VLFTNGVALVFEVSVIAFEVNVAVVTLETIEWETGFVGYRYWIKI
jgi:hypothetical protein